MLFTTQKDLEKKCFPNDTLTNNDVVLVQGDCLAIMDKLIEQNVKVDLILTDPPYGTTRCQWDTIIPLEKMWDKINQLTKERTPIVLFGSEPFSSTLRISNIKDYKYDWIWKKERGSGFLNAKKQPLRQSENISVFYKKQCLYNPQMREGEPYNRGMCKSPSSNIQCYGKTHDVISYSKDGKRYPLTILEYNTIHNSSKHKKHPTQKPVPLLEYLIKTYTKKGDLVLDFTMGSGSTGVACKNLERKFIGIELDKNYFNIAKERIEQTN